MLPRDAGVDELVELLNAPGYDAVAEVDEAVGVASVQEQHPAAVQLMAGLNAQMQELGAALRGSLEQLEKSGKRVPHEIELLKNDVRRLDAQQEEAVPGIVARADAARRSAVLDELATLDEVRRRVEEVRALLVASQGQPPEDTRKRLAAVFAGTPDESKWTSSKYYGMFTKMIT